jgi:hypothetical protein
MDKIGICDTLMTKGVKQYLLSEVGGILLSVSRLI